MQLVLPQSWSLWSFHWLDGWITVTRILERLPRKNDKRSLTEGAQRGPVLRLEGRRGRCAACHCHRQRLIRAGRKSVLFVKDNLIEVAKLRAGYSALCWIVGIGAYIGSIALFATVDIVPEHNEIYGHIYAFYFWAAVPILIATGIVMLLLRPIYVLALCDLYSDHLQAKGIEVDLPEKSKAATSALVAFAVLCLLTVVAYVYRVELGIVDALSTLYGQ